MVFRFWMCVALAAGCAAEDGTDSLATPTSGSELTTATEPVDDCQAGMRIGRCPADFSLPTGAGELISLHEQRGGRVAVIGSAEA